MFNKHENVRSYCSDNKNEKKVLLYLINYGLEPIGLIQINGWIDRLLYNESYVKSCQVVTCHGRTYQQILILIFLNIYYVLVLAFGGVSAHCATV